MNLSDYQYRIEMHAHTTPVSGCSEVEPEELIRRYADRGYDAVVITNHFFPGTRYIEDKARCIDYYMANFYQAKNAGEQRGIKVILGMEIRFITNDDPNDLMNNNDYLVYGIDEEFIRRSYDYLPLGIEQFYRDMKREDNVILQAHPFRDNLMRAPVDCIDGIETFNMHPNHNSRVSMASLYAAEHDYIVTAGTDFHHSGHEGMAAVLSKTLPETSYDIATLLQSRDYLFRLGSNIVLPYQDMK